MLPLTPGGRVRQRDQPVGGVGQVVLVVGREVQHHVVAERVAHAELEGDRLAEVDVGTVDVVGVGQVDVAVDALEHHPEVRRLHLVGVGEPEVGPLGHRERDLDVRAQVAVALVLAEQIRVVEESVRIGRIVVRMGSDDREAHRPLGPAVIPVVPQTAHQDHVAQVEPILDEDVPADRLLEEDVGEDLVVELVRVVPDIVVGELAAQLHPVVAIELPVEVGLSDPAVLLVHDQPGCRAASRCPLS